MEIKMDRVGDELTVAVVGRLDTLTAPELEQKLRASLDGVKSLVFDFKELEYISSAGLRVLLTAMQAMDGKGTMKVTNVSDVVMSVFEITGFADDLNIE